MLKILYNIRIFFITNYIADMVHECEQLNAEIVILVEDGNYSKALEMIDYVISRWPICCYDNYLGKAMILIEAGSREKAGDVLAECEAHINKYKKAYDILTESLSQLGGCEAENQRPLP